ncbi:MAG TPA: hypothetical protein VI911_02440 [Patescibacteria group bacterium]|nr:hypothetical protein [Patescibacteria group bacterium]
MPTYIVNNVEYRLIAVNDTGFKSVWEWGTKEKAVDLQKVAQAMFPRSTYTIQSRPKKDLAANRARSTQR